MRDVTWSDRRAVDLEEVSAGDEFGVARKLFFAAPSAVELRREDRLARKVRDMRPSRRLGGPTD